MSKTLLKHNLFGFNFPSNAYTFESSRSNIDVICMDVAAKAFVQSWRLLSESNLSGHFSIEVMLVNRNVITSVDSPLTPIRRNSRGYNWVEELASSK